MRVASKLDLSCDAAEARERAISHDNHFKVQTVKCTAMGASFS